MSLHCLWDEKASRARGWIIGNTKIGPVLDVKVCLHQERYGIEILIESLFRDGTASRVRIVNWIKKCHRNVRNHFPWECWHDKSVPREDGGAVRFDDIMEEFRKSSMVLCNGQLPIGYLFWQKGGGAKKRFQYCLNPNSSWHFLYFREIQGQSGGNIIDPELQDNVLLPEGFTEYIYKVGNASEMNSIIRSWLNPGGRSLKRGRQSVFFTVTNPMEDDNGVGEIPCDLTKPRIAPYKNTWKLHRNTVSWCNLKLAQRKGLQFYQTRSHAVVLYDTLPAVCIEEAIRMKPKEELT